jgi:DNA-binding response OmpR family regulator
VHQAKEDEAMNSEDTQAVAQRAVKVLLISPFDEDHQHLHDILKHSNWQQYGARTQREALEFLSENTTPVVICESELTDGSWQDVLCQLGTMPCSPLLVVTSRMADDRLWSEVLNLGAYNVLAKPLNMKEVFHVVGLAWMSWKRRWERPQLRVTPGTMARPLRYARASA